MSEELPLPATPVADAVAPDVPQEPPLEAPKPLVVGEASPGIDETPASQEWLAILFSNLETRLESRAQVTIPTAAGKLTAEKKVATNGELASILVRIQRSDNHQDTYCIDRFGKIIFSQRRDVTLRGDAERSGVREPSMLSCADQVHISTALLVSSARKRVAAVVE